MRVLLAGATRMAEVLRLAAEALGVPAAVGAALRLDSRELRGEDTLAQADVPRGGGEVEVWVGQAGGMPGFARRLCAVQGWRDVQAEALEAEALRLEKALRTFKLDYMVGA